MTIIPNDTPDNQRGVFNPQQVIGSFGAVASGVVQLPPNCQSLLVFTKGAPQPYQLQSVVGVTTGLEYPASAMNFPTSGPYNSVYAVVAMPGVDGQVTVTWGGAPTHGWGVIADAGVRQVVDQTLFALAAENGLPAIGGGLEVFGWDLTDDRQLLTDNTGRLNVIQVGANLHVHGTVGNGGQVLAAPAAGTANLITQIILGCTNVPECTQIVGASSGVIYATVIESAAGYNYPAQLGGPLETTEQLLGDQTSVNQNVFFSIHYRVIAA